MSTRALIKFQEEGKRFACIYHHCDGYPEGLGKKLAEFLKGKAISNGISKDAFNGMGCLAASVVEHLKDGPGGVYLYEPDAEDLGEEYHYIILESNVSGKDDNIIIECYEGASGAGKMLYEGTGKQFLAWLANRE